MTNEIAHRYPNFVEILLDKKKKQAEELQSMAKAEALYVTATQAVEKATKALDMDTPPTVEVYGRTVYLSARIAHTDNLENYKGLAGAITSALVQAGLRNAANVSPEPHLGGSVPRAYWSWGAFDREGDYIGSITLSVTVPIEGCRDYAVNVETITIEESQYNIVPRGSNVVQL